MTEDEFAAFLNKMDLPPLTFDEQNPFSFTLDGHYNYTLEYNEEGQVVVVLSLPLPQYEKERLERALTAASYLQERELDFAVGYRRDCLMLFTALNANCSGTQLLEAVLALKRQADKLEE